MAEASILIDSTVCVFTVIWFFRHTGFRLYLNFALFYSLRGFIQNRFLMGRPEGFLWYDPGFPSLTIAYHNISDFYYSGHLGLCTIFLCEFIALGYRKIAILMFFVLLNEGFLLIIVRTHYCIDLFTGIVVAMLMSRVSEYICYLHDVKLCGYPI